MEANLDDLLHEYNNRLSEEIRRRQAKDIIIMGPPLSGKSTFRERFLRDFNVVEEAIGLLSLETEELEHRVAGLDLKDS